MFRQRFILATFKKVAPYMYVALKYMYIHKSFTFHINEFSHAPIVLYTWNVLNLGEEIRQRKN